MEITVKKETFACPGCRAEYPSKEEARSCLNIHMGAFTRACPTYQPGENVRTCRHNDSRYGLEVTRIIRAKGELWELKLLVESEDGERYWVNAVTQHTLDLRNNPTKFQFVEPA